MEQAGAELQRDIGLPLLTLYGIGIIIGAGIYILIGTVAERAGVYAPLAFVLAGIVALPTALSYAELSSRVPEAGGVAAYIEKGMGLHRLSLLVGLFLVVSGIFSGAAVLRGGVGYLAAFMDVSEPLAIIGVGAVLMAVALVGVFESLLLAGIFTLIEVAGLALVIWAGFSAPAVIDIAHLPPPFWPGIGAGAALAFFAYLGFEDMVNLAEETRSARRTMPLAIVLAVVLTSVLYFLVAAAAVRAVPVEALAGSGKPLVLVWQAGFGHDGRTLALIAVFSALNGVLAQIIMGSRLLYGMGRHSRALAVFHRVSPRLRTPVFAILLVGVALIAAALAHDVAGLAKRATSVLLVIFTVANISLIRMKRRQPDATFRVPAFVPWLGALFSLAALVASWGGA